MGIFTALPPDWWLTRLVEWITVGGKTEEDVNFYMSSVLPGSDLDEIRLAPGDWTEDELELRASLLSRDNLRQTIARLQIALIQGWADDEWREDRDDLNALEVWAAKYAIHLRRSLIEPAGEDEIAEALCALADVLDQNVRAQTAAFIIELVGKAQLPIYLVRSLFERVAASEAGRLKPASFTRLLVEMTPRWQQARRAAADARTFVEHLQPALAHLRKSPSRARFQ